MDSLPGANNDSDDDIDDDSDDNDDDWFVLPRLSSTSQEDDIQETNSNEEQDDTEQQVDEEEISGGDTYLAYHLQRKLSSSNTILTKVTTIVNTAKYVIDQIDNKNDGWCVQSKTDDPQFYYKKSLKRLTRQEYLYYLKRRTAKGVLAEIHKDAKRIISKYHNPFTLIPLATMPEYVQQGFILAILCDVDFNNKYL